jgi:hypothetical protein
VHERSSSSWSNPSENGQSVYEFSLIRAAQINACFSIYEPIFVLRAPSSYKPIVVPVGNRKLIFAQRVFVLRAVFFFFYGATARSRALASFKWRLQTCLSWDSLFQFLTFKISLLSISTALIHLFLDLRAVLEEHITLVNRGITAHPNQNDASRRNAGDSTTPFPTDGTD